MQSARREEDDKPQVKKGVNYYFAEIDKRLPPWKAQRTTSIGTVTGLTPEPGNEAAQGWSAEDLETSTRDVRVEFRADPDDENSELVHQVVTMPYQPYVRAVHPDGRLTTLLISQTRFIGDERQAGYADKIMAAKQRRGWLIAERDQGHRGLVDEEYGKFLFAEMKRRSAAHAAKMERAAAAFESRKDKRAQETADATLHALRSQGEALTQIALAATGAAPDDVTAKVDALAAQNAELAATNKALMAKLEALIEKKK